MAEEMGLTQLVGSWRLVSLGVTYADTKERIELYGPHPTGYMVLSPNGRIMFLFTRADRTPPQTDAERATLFSAMTAYTGHVPNGRSPSLRAVAAALAARGFEHQAGGTIQPLPSLRCSQSKFGARRVAEVSHL
jgi:hypothetical protein